MFPVKPIGKKCIVKSKKDATKKQVIITLEEKPYYHQVVAIGDDDCPVKEGDLVRCDDYALRPFKMPEQSDEDYFIILYAEILAVKIN